jgi:NADH dehydrogenase
MILITGSTGFIGRHLVARLLADGRAVRCLLPEGVDYTWDAPVQPEVVRGMLGDDEALFRAATGISTIVHLDSGQWWGNARQLERVEVYGTRNLVEAARAARVGRVVLMSHLGATPASGYPLLRVKGTVEEIVRASGMAYTVLRTGLVFGEDDAFYSHIAMALAMNPFVYVMPGRGEVVIHPLYIHDLVAILAQTLENIDTVDAVIEIGGPEYITLRDLLRTIMRVTGRGRPILPLPPYLVRGLGRISRVFTPRTLMTPQWFDLLATNRVAQLGTVPRYFDVRLHRLEDTMLTYMPGRYGWFAAVRYLWRRPPRRRL